MGGHSLYAKYRPQTFSDLVGQSVIVETIKRQVESGRVSHAYLFSGPKGSGKTTMARLIAKAVNCEKRKAGAEPCDDCRSCKEIALGRSLDVVELDAASHTGVSDVGEIREAVKFAPHGGKKRVFIIDEVHMLSKGAFNALLKTLEEPPAHTIFVLATTEIGKVPDTIRSRCQEFHFKRATVADLSVYLSKIAKAEKIDLRGEAISTLASLAEGSFRDAVSLVEQVSGATRGTVSAEDVRRLLGLASEEATLTFLHALSEKNTREALRVVSELAEKGIDAGDFLRSVTLALRNFLLYLSNGSEAMERRLTEAEQNSFASFSKVWNGTATVSLLEKLLGAKELLRLSPTPTLPIEMVTVEWCSRTESNEVKENEKNAKSPVTLVPVAKELSKLDQGSWNQILKLVKEENHSLYAILRESLVLGETADGVAVAVRFRFHAELLDLPRHREVLSECVTKTLGRAAGIVVEVKPEAFTKQEEDLIKFAQELL